MTSIDGPPARAIEVAGPLAAAEWVTGAVRGARRGCALVATTTRLILEGRAEPQTKPRAFALRAQRTARALLAQHGVEVLSVGPLPRTPCVLVTNHLSYIDPLAVACVAPCIAIAKGETVDWPLIGPGLQALGVVFVRRGDAHSGARALLRARKALRAGAVVLNFPEGTTSDGLGVGAFRRGIFGLAQIAGVPVVPAHISYSDPRAAWYGSRAFAPHYLRLCSASGVRARVWFGDPIPTDGREDPAALATRARAVIDALRARGAG